MTATATRTGIGIPIFAGPILVLDGEHKDGPYWVTVEDGEYIDIQVGFIKKSHRKHTDKAACVEPHEFHFKHYNNGHKHWTTKQGWRLTYRVPKAALSIVPKHGWSYPALYIGETGIILELTTGGGSYENGWADRINATTSTLVDLDSEVVEALRSVALAGVEVESAAAAEKRKQDYYEAHKDKHHVISAWGSWADWVPMGMVGVCACIGGWIPGTHHHGPDESYWLVPADEYRKRGETFGIFVIDPERHHRFEGNPTERAQEA